MDEQNGDDEAAIRAVIDRFSDAFRAKDVNGVMAPFANEIVSFDIVPPLQTVGAETFVTHWRQLFDSYEGPIQLEVRDVRIATGGDIAYSYCVHRVTGTLRTGQRTDRWLRWTACYRKVNDTWRIVHEHVSAPIDPKSGKALVDLQP